MFKKPDSSSPPLRPAAPRPILPASLPPAGARTFPSKLPIPVPAAADKPIAEPKPAVPATQTVTSPLRIGRMNVLTVLRLTKPGAFLGDGVTELLLPYKFVPQGIQPGDTIEVFVYLDSEDRLVATTQISKVQVGQFAALTVKSMTYHGAFLDWGLDKDLLLPFAEMTRELREGYKVPIFVYLDQVTRRIVASSKLRRYTKTHPDRLHEGSAVDAMPFESTEIGYRCLVNRKYEGMLYKDQIFGRLQKGDEIRAFVSKVRDDGLIDLCMRPTGYVAVIDQGVPKLLEMLQPTGFIPFTADSDPEAIRIAFKMSKRDFKKAIGALYKQRLITIEEHGIRLIKDSGNGPKNQP